MGMVDPCHVPDQSSPTTFGGRRTQRKRKRVDRGSHPKKPSRPSRCGTIFKFKFNDGSVDNHETAAMVESDDDDDTVVNHCSPVPIPRSFVVIAVRVAEHEDAYLSYEVPRSSRAAGVLWRLAWAQQGHARPFECECWLQLLRFLRLVNTAPCEAAALWELAVLPDGGVLLGRHSSIDWEQAVRELRGRH